MKTKKHEEFGEGTGRAAEDVAPPYWGACVNGYGYGAPDSCFFSRNCLSAIMARSVNCLCPNCPNYSVQVRLIGARPIVQVRR